ncbi:MAG TPA: NADH-quinone oxidoreductase subunit H, partial [Alphaproteobacteria bacterium]|nr:NADH-quinone oxidoreductase subunit H [Alphaproteobacteria bacterium]
MAESNFWLDYILPLLLIVGYILAIVVPILLVVAVVVYGERKIWAAMQFRKGPNVVGPLGLFQPLADGLKMMIKETIIPAGANRILFLMAPMIMFTLGLIG